MRASVSYLRDPLWIHPESGYRAAVICVFALAVASCGCSSIDLANRHLIVERTHFHAEREAKRLRECTTVAANNALELVNANSAPPLPGDYQEGFRSGYADFLQFGGSGEPPPMPPRRYWGTDYQTPLGRYAVQNWFAGFRHGSWMARASGLRNMITIPVSGAGILVAEYTSYPTVVMRYQQPVEDAQSPLGSPRPTLNRPAEQLGPPQRRDTRPRAGENLPPARINAPQPDSNRPQVRYNLTRPATVWPLRGYELHRNSERVEGRSTHWPDSVDQRRAPPELRRLPMTRPSTTEFNQTTVAYPKQNRTFTPVRQPASSVVPPTRVLSREATGESSPRPGIRFLPAPPRIQTNPYYAG